MRTTAVPAQVTTVEDRIVGNLGITQLVLFFIPIVFGSLLYAILPPGMHGAAYKLLLLTTLLLICVTLAVRVKGTIVLFWVVKLLRYWLRPRYYVFDKRSAHGREQHQLISEPIELPVRAPKRTHKRSSLSIEDIVNAREVITSSATQVAFETRKGGLYVRITEIK